jgi:hypothetical protein
MIRFLCNIFSGGMNKSYQSDATKMLHQFDASHPNRSEAQRAEVEKHRQIFTRPKGLI